MHGNLVKLVDVRVANNRWIIGNWKHSFRFIQTKLNMPTETVPCFSASIGTNFSGLVIKFVGCPRGPEFDPLFFNIETSKSVIILSRLVYNRIWRLFTSGKKTCRQKRRIFEWQIIKGCMTYFLVLTSSW